MDESAFRAALRGRLVQMLRQRQEDLTGSEVIRIDLHCHDHNSQVPDEIMGRILGVPETWLATDELLRVLERNGMTARTVTNHNNARSCFDLLDKGVDVLVGSEFSCQLRTPDVGVHVLAYGFSPQQEVRLNALRGDLLSFLEYARSWDIPCVLAHPLDFHSPRGAPSPEGYDTLLLLFDTFEIMNGQRDSWQNLLAAAWVDSATPERLDATSRRTGIAVGEFVRSPYLKRGVGGSDDHFGVFAGSTGTLLSLPLQSKVSACSSSALALAALREGRCAPFGSWSDGEKLQLAFLDYFAEAALKMKDPGLMRVLLHPGTLLQRGAAVLIANTMFEIRRQPSVMKFLKVFHETLRGRAPGFWTRMALPREFQPLLDALGKISAALRPDARAPSSEQGLDTLFLEASRLLFARAAKKQLWRGWNSDRRGERSEERGGEIPIYLRTLWEGSSTDFSRPDSLASALDGLSFPFLASGVVAGSSFFGTKYLYNQREFKSALSERYPGLQNPRRVLWLTDTFGDKNGVSRVLSLLAEEVHSRQLPMDFLACGTPRREKNVRFLEPLGEFTHPSYPQQPLRIPNLIEIRSIMQRGGYDSVVCSTEGPMALVALFLKHAFQVPTFFYAHTDWLTFARDAFQASGQALESIRLLLRTLYANFDGVFLLNSEHEEIFSGDAMGIPREKIFRTSHWVGDAFRPGRWNRAEVLPELASEGPILLYAGRLSEEKGVGLLPGILEEVRRREPRARLLIAGEGPAEMHLRQSIPDAHFTGWVNEERLTAIYGVSDLLVLPSRFDTFGCVVVEAMACGLPVCAFASKGPRDIIEHGVNGFLAHSDDEFCHQVREYISTPRGGMREAALKRAADFTADAVLPTLLRPLGLHEGSSGAPLRSAGGF